MSIIAKIKLLSLCLFICFGFAMRGAETDSLDYYMDKEQQLKALKFGLRESDRLLHQKSYRALCMTNFKISKVYVRLRDFDKSTNLLFKTLKIAEAHDLKFEQALLLNEIAKTYQTTLNLPKAIRYFKRGEKLAVALKNDTLAAFMQQGLFSVYALSKKDKDSGRYYMQQILRTLKPIGNSDQLNRAYGNFGAYYFLFGDLPLGKKYLDTATHYAEINRKRKYLITNYNNLGYYYLQHEKNLEKGKQEYLKILALNPKDTVSAEVTDCYLNLSYIYEQSGDFKTANSYLNRYIVNTEIIFQDKINTQLKSSETKYQVEKVEEHYRLMQLELEEQQSRRQKIFIIVIGLILILVILFYFFNQNLRLKEKNKLKDLQSKAQQNLLNATLDGQESERKKIAGVLHDSVSAQLSSAGLHLSAYVAGSGTKSEEIDKTRSIIKEAHDTVRDLSHRLVPTLLARFGLLYALRDLCEKSSNSLLEFTYESQIADRTRYSEDIEMRLYFIVTELLNNVTKHSGASQCKLEVYQSGNTLHLSVEDDGKGFNAKSQKQEGFGLTQIRARVENMKGSLRIVSEPGEGTAVMIAIPLG